MYRPRPIDTTGIELPGDINDLVEMLARNTHENWSMQRIQDGWTLGEKRDDAGKKHPCLVPYEELPESEKTYDRKISVEIIKTILSLGYRITK